MVPSRSRGAVPSDQVLVAGRGEVAGRRPDTALRLDTIERVKCFQHCQQAGDVGLAPRMNHIDIEGSDGRAVEDRCQPTDHDELDARVPQRAEHREKVILRHSVRESR